MGIINATAFAGNALGIFNFYACSRKQLTKSRTAVLMYHRVCPNNNGWSFETIKPHIFEQQMEYFCRKYEILSLADLIQYIYARRGKLPKKSIVVTFDDGYLDNYLYAYPILNKYHIPATIFLTTGHISSDRLFWWDKVGYIIQNTNKRQLNFEELGYYSLQSAKGKNKAQKTITEALKHINEDRKNLLIEKFAQIAGVDIPSGLAKELILSWNKIKEMNSDGISFGAHTVNHPILTNMSLEQAKWEIIQSKKDIEKELGKEVNTFSYPNGNSNPEIIKLIKENGFSCSVSIGSRLIRMSDNIYALGRIMAVEDFNILKAKLCGLWGDVRPLLMREE